MKVLTITENEAGQRLDKYLAKYLDKAPKSFIYKMLRKKNMVLNGRKCDGSEKIQTGDEIKLFLSDETIASFREQDKHTSLPVSDVASLSVIYEDEDIIIIDKPVGMLSQRAKAADISANEYIRAYLAQNPEKRQESDVYVPSVCNRLDRNTTGLLTAGKTLKGAQFLSEQFRERNCKKYYLCVVTGILTQRIRTTAYLAKNEKNNRVSVSSLPVKGAEAIAAEYIPVCCNENYSLVKVQLLTGKPHQIRAHLAYLGYPLVGDFKYGKRRDCERVKSVYGIEAQLLHSFELKLSEKIHVFAPLPDKMRNFLDGEKIWVHGRQEDLEALH